MMRTKQLLRLGLMLLLVAPVTTAVAQLQRIPCSEVLEAEREFVRRFGGCRDVAPIVDARPDAGTAAVDFPVSSVIGLGFDDARNQLGRFTIQRSYRASADPGGIVLAQQPAPPARLAAGAIVRLTLSDGTLRPQPRVPESQVDGIVTPQAPSPASASSSAPASSPAPASRQPVSEPMRSGQLIAQAPTNTAPVTGPGSARTATSREMPIHVQQHHVPNVVGMWHRDARRQLELFEVERRYRPSDAPAGRVIDQIPKASSRLSSGSEVLLIVSSGPAKAAQRGVAVAAPILQTIELPNVVERSIGDVTSALAEFKVELVNVRSAAPKGLILEQEPASGRALPPGSTVTLRVSDGSLAVQPITVPATPPNAGATSQASAPATESPPVTTPSAAAEPAQAATSATASAPPSTPVAETKSQSAPAENGMRDQLTFTLTLPNPTELAIGAAVLFALLVGWMALRRRREPSRFIETVDIEPQLPARIEFAPTHVNADAAEVAAPEPAPAKQEVVEPRPIVVPVAPTVIRFVTRFQAGDVTVEFTGPPETEGAVKERPSVHHA